MSNLRKQIDTVRSMIVCGFGYQEVEEAITIRCEKCIKMRSMEPLKKPLEIYCWSGCGEYLYIASAANICLRLYKMGIWQYIKGIIKEKNKKKKWIFW